MRSRTIVSGALALFVTTGANGGNGCGGGGGGSAGAAGSAGATSTPTGSATGAPGGGTGMPGGGAGGPLQIYQIVSGGPGCPSPDAVKVDVDQDTGTVRLTYPPLTLSHSPGATFHHTSCTTGLTVHGVAGQQYGATSLKLHGTADLPSGAHAEASVHLAFAGAPPTEALQSQLMGPTQGPYDLTGGLAAGTLLKSPCGQDSIFTIRVELTMEVPAGSQDSASLEAVSLELPIGWWGC